jgi:hypothetical protein
MAHLDVWVGEGDKQRIFDGVLEQLRDDVGRALGTGADSHVQFAFRYSKPVATCFAGRASSPWVSQPRASPAPPLLFIKHTVREAAEGDGGLNLEVGRDLGLERPEESGRGGRHPVSCPYTMN